MSRRIRRGRRGIDLPLKNPPDNTDLVVGHDANGNPIQVPVDALGGEFDIGALPNRASLADTDQFPLQASGTNYRASLAALKNELLRQSFSVRVASNGTSIVNLPGRVALSVTRPSTGVYVLTNAAGLVFYAAVATPIGNAHAVARLQGTNSSALTVTWAALGSGAAVNMNFALVGELA